MLFKSKKILGIDIGSSSIKAAELNVGKKGYHLSSFSMTPTPTDAINGGEIVQAAVLSSAIKSMISEMKVKRKNVATNIWGSAVIVKKITVPKMEAKLVSEQIKWEAEQYIPFDINEISLEFHILENVMSGPETMDVLLVAAKKDFVFSYYSVIEKAGLRCSVLDISNFALANCFEANYGKMQEVVVLLHLGAKVTNLVVIDNGEVVFCRDIPIGGINYTNDIHKEMGVSIDEAESLKLSAVMNQQVPEEVNSIISATSEVITDEIQNSFDFYTATANNTTISRFYVSGGCSGIPGLIQQVSSTSGIPFEIFNPFIGITYDKKKFSFEYIEQIKPYAPIALGLAMRAVGDT